MQDLLCGLALSGAPYCRQNCRLYCRAALLKEQSGLIFRVPVRMMRSVIQLCQFFLSLSLCMLRCAEHPAVAWVPSKLCGAVI